MINELIEQLILELKNEDVYHNYIKALENLNQHEQLLEKYRHIKEEYIRMKPYFKYQDFTELKNDFFSISNQVTELDAFLDYQKASKQMKERLDTLTAIVFDEILVEAEETVCVSSQENTNEEI